MGLLDSILQFVNSGRFAKENGDHINIADIAEKVNEVASGISIIRSGVKAFRVATYFTRPSDVIAYAVDDAITDSTTVPMVVSCDLSGDGAVVGQDFMITDIAVVVSSKVSSGGFNIWINNLTFPATIDNTGLSIDDTVARTGITIPCLDLYKNALNSRFTNSGQWIGKLASNSTSIYLELQAAIAMTLGSGDRIDITINGVLL